MSYAVLKLCIKYICEVWYRVKCCVLIMYFFLFTDLQTIELRITEKSYKKLSEFIGDMTKIFDNCRYYNPRESPFFKCAESLEAYFVQKVKGLRDKLVDNK